MCRSKVHVLRCQQFCRVARCAQPAELRLLCCRRYHQRMYMAAGGECTLHSRPGMQVWVAAAQTVLLVVSGIRYAYAFCNTFGAATLHRTARVHAAAGFAQAATATGTWHSKERGACTHWFRTRWCASVWLCDCASWRGLSLRGVTEAWLGHAKSRREILPMPEQQ